MGAGMGERYGRTVWENGMGAGKGVRYGSTVTALSSNG